jgi:hypothetical protein
MSAHPATAARRLAAFMAYAYRTLLLTFLLVSALRLLGGDGGWINDFAVLLILSAPLALDPGLRRARRP